VGKSGLIRDDYRIFVIKDNLKALNWKKSIYDEVINEYASRLTDIVLDKKIMSEYKDTNIFRLYETAGSAIIINEYSKSLLESGGNKGLIYEEVQVL
jgi:hypothetical protein